MTTIGILGAGQLGRMMALAGYPLGLSFRFLDPAAGSPAGQLAPQNTANYTDEAVLEQFARQVDLVTYEFENVPVQAARFLADRVPVFPPPQALEAAQDRIKEKSLFRSLGIATPAFAPIDSPTDFQPALRLTGLPAVLKTRRLGYDGKGQRLVHSAAELGTAAEELGRRDLILEEFVAFERELSILAVRGRALESGLSPQVAFYPLVENHHREGVLRLTLAPAPHLHPGQQEKAESLARAVLERLDYCGVLAIELFERRGELLANEMAPRVHNSGHWTIEGAPTSQFANHLRAGLGWPLGLTSAQGFAAMINLIGSAPPASDILDIPEAHLHLYAKAPRPGRKIGHINLVAPGEAELRQAIGRLRQRLDIPELARYNQTTRMEI